MEGDKELQRFFSKAEPPADFNDFRGRLAGLTAVTRKFFQTLVTELARDTPRGGADGAQGGGCALGKGDWAAVQGG